MDLQERIDLLRAKPLRILCRTTAGEEKVMSVSDCIKSGASYIHIVDDEIDALLSKTLDKEISNRKGK